jgi:hypothetical protein
VSLESIENQKLKIEKVQSKFKGKTNNCSLMNADLADLKGQKSKVYAVEKSDREKKRGCFTT